MHSTARCRFGVLGPSPPEPRITLACSWDLENTTTIILDLITVTVFIPEQGAVFSLDPAYF
jgi:hypothetical protein